MEVLLSNFNKSSCSYKGRKTNGITDAVPKKSTFLPIVKRLVMVILFMLSGIGFAQTDTYMYWDSSVGCIEFDYVGDPKRKLEFIENIEDAPCIRVCEGSQVHYFIEGSNIVSVNWQATGGVVQNVWTSPHKARVQWGGAGDGSITVTITYADNTVKTYTMCVDIINSPKAYFEVETLAEPVFCMETPIVFDNLSFENGGTEIIHYLWDFGDPGSNDNFSSEFEPTHSYSNPGTYTVQLTVINKCNCSSTYKMDIIITEKMTVDISCPSVVCEGDKATYTASDECGGIWQIEGGHIIAGGNGYNFVEVVWDDIDPEEGFGYVHYRSECGCPYWITEKVPVILSKAKIKGDPVICLGSQNRFTLPQWPTTEFFWSLTTDTTPSQVIYTDQRNEVVIEGLVPGNYILNASYNNTLLGCGGVASLKITVAPEIEIIGGELSFCSGVTHTYTTSTGVPVDWQLKHNNAVIASPTGVNFTHNFSIGGTYVLTAASSGGCLSEPFIIEVTQTPATPTGTITGETWVCSGVTYDYSYNNTVPGTVLVWEVTGSAAIQGSNTGNSISVNFTGTGPYEVKVKRVSTDGLLCESGWLTLNVAVPNINPVITNDDNLTIFCPSSVTSFTADFGSVVPDLIEWSVFSDPSENENFGNIIDGYNSPNVTVSWNEITAGEYEGTLRLKVTHCGQVHIFDTPIVLYQMPTITLDDIDYVCPEDPTLIVTVTTPGVTTGSLLFEFGNGSTQTVPVNITGVYTIANDFTNSTATNVTQSLTVSLLNPNGCLYSPSDTQIVTVYPETKITITPGYNVTICPDNPYTYTLNCNVSTGITSSVSIQWYKGSNPITGATTSSYTISTATQGATPGGIYYVEVTDINGCVVYSQNINVHELCDPLPPCSPVPAPTIGIDGTWNCNQINAWVTYDITPDYINWVGAGLQLVSGQGTANVTYSTTVPGSYLILAELYYGDCKITKNVTVEKYYQPKLSIGTVCHSSSGIYDVTLFNNSTVFGMDPDDITFTYTGPGISGSVTGQQHTVTGLSPGTYTYTLTLSSPGKPTCSVNQSITLAPMPDVDFDLTETEYCAEETITLTIPNYNPANTYSWHFTNTHYYASGATTDINIATAGTYGITLRAQTPQGCVIESDDIDIVILKAVFSGNFLPSPVNICEGESFPGISFSPALGNPAPPTDIIWMRGNQQVGTGLTYTPTQSGPYWGVLVDSLGCRFNKATPLINVTVRKKPYVSITGENSLCGGESTTLQGVITDSNLERRWLTGTSPAVPVSGPHGVWSTSTPLTLDVNPTTPGSYTYTLQVRPVGDEDCGNSAVFTVTAHPEVTVPALDFQIMYCEPYEVKIWVTNFVSTGNYNWSDGQNGGAITVYAGGVYGVTYTAPSGCTATAEIMVPHNPDRYMWIFPTGCFDVCPWDNPAPYIVGPWGEFDQHKWLINDITVQGGTNGPVSNLTVNQPGAYQLYIENGICNYESGIAFISPNPELEGCEIIDCDPKMELYGITYDGGGVYHLHGYIDNAFGFPITVTFTSLNGYGTYSPPSITIPASSTYTFPPLIFTSNPGFYGGDDYLIISIPEIPCMTAVPVRFVPEGGGYRMMMEEPQTDQAELSVTPNPAEVLAVVSYNLGSQYSQAENLVIYTAEGRRVSTIKLDKNSDDVVLDTAKLPVGTYIISLQADGKTVLHQKLIKK